MKTLIGLTIALAVALTALAADAQPATLKKHGPCDSPVAVAPATSARLAEIQAQQRALAAEARGLTQAESKKAGIRPDGVRYDAKTGTLVPRRGPFGPGRGE